MFYSDLEPNQWHKTSRSVEEETLLFPISFYCCLMRYKLCGQTLYGRLVQNVSPDFIGQIMCVTR